MDSKNQQRRARSRAVPEAEPLFTESPAFPGEAVCVEGLPTWVAERLGQHRDGGPWAMVLK